MTSLPPTTKIETRLDNGWLTIAFASPENRNALSAELSDDLRTVLHAVKDNRAVRGITLRGHGPVFCAGADLKGFQSGFHGQEAAHADVAMANRKGGELFALVDAMPQVVLVLAHGAAIAGGMGLVCCADVVAVTEDAQFSLTETQLGIAPAQIAPYVVRRLGMATARRLMLTGARFKGKEAKAMGLADYVAADIAGLDEIEAAVRKSVLRCAPGANGRTKDILRQIGELPMEALMDFAADRFADCMLDEEGREGIASFTEKRKPVWAEQSA